MGDTHGGTSVHMGSQPATSASSSSASLLWYYYHEIMYFSDIIIIFFVFFSLKCDYHKITEFWICYPVDMSALFTRIFYTDPWLFMSSQHHYIVVRSRHKTLTTCILSKHWYADV